MSAAKLGKKCQFISHSCIEGIASHFAVCGSKKRRELLGAHAIKGRTDTAGVRLDVDAPLGWVEMERF